MYDVEVPHPLPVYAVALGLVAVGLLSYQVIAHFRHPLYGFPGPFWASISNIPHCLSLLGGRQPYDRLALHEKYGPVVRTSPDELSFSSSQAWRDIYGFRPGHKTFVKSPFYDGARFGGHTPSIVTVTDPSVHKTMRAQLSHAFSDKSLRDQEHLIAELVDLFIAQIGEKGDCAEGIDIVLWFNLLTFDIISSLAFGESFGGLESGKFHDWIKSIKGTTTMGSLADSLARFPVVGAYMMKYLPGIIDKLLKDFRKHEVHTMDLVRRRLKATSDRPDFLTRIIEKREAHNISDIQIGAHSGDFIIAGSETTATALSCMTYHLLRNSDIYKKLQEEVRGAFATYEDIDSVSASKLRYVNAVCLEAMRVYPPFPLSLPRVVPPGGEIVDGRRIPGGIIVGSAPLASSLSSANFQDPLEFRPERWIEQNENNDLEASQPFSYGIRACLGRGMAWMEMNLTLCKLHYKYDLELLSTELDWHRDSKMQIIWQKPEMRVRVKPRSS